MKSDRLDILKASPVLVAKYQDAVLLLQELQIDIILMEMNLPTPFSPLTGEKLVDVAAFDSFESQGWENCRYTIFNLLEGEKSDGE